MEIEPSLYAADFARLGDQVRSCSTPARASSTSTSATAISSSRSRWARSSSRRSPRSSTGRRRPRLPSDGLEPRAPLPADQEGRRRQRHLSRRGLRGAVERDRARPLARPRGRRRLQPRDAGGGRRRRLARSRSRPLHEHPSRLLGPGVHAGGALAAPRPALAAPRARGRPGGRRDHGRQRPRHAYDVGAEAIVAGTAIFGFEDTSRAYHRLVRALVPDE